MYTAAIFALTMGLVAAQNEQIYATFYDDTACQVNGGTPVAVMNPGCLAEANRNSIYFQDGTYGGAQSLVFSPDSACGCENQCIDRFVPDELPGCVSLEGNMAAASFRFQGESCPPPNC